MGDKPETDAPEETKKCDDPATVLEEVEKPLRTVKRYVIQDYDGLDYEELPEGWVRVRHVSGIMVYMHQLTRVVTLSRPYNVGSGNLRYHRLPRFAIPCLAYRYRKTTTEPIDQSSSSNTTEDLVKTLDENKPTEVTDEHATIIPDESIGISQFDNASGAVTCDILTKNREADDGDADDVNDDKEEGELSTDDDETTNSPPPAKKTRKQSPDDDKMSQKRSLLEATTKTISGNLEIYACQPETNETVATETKIEKNKLDTSEHEKVLTLAPEDVREYCSRLFEIKEEEAVVFRNRNERFKFMKQKKKDGRQVQLGMLATEQKNLIRYQIPPVEGCPARRQVKEGVINPVGKSSVCILHEYCQNVIRKPPTYKMITMPDNEKSPYQVTVVVNDVVYPSGSGTSKKQARAEAARNALEKILPEYKQVMESVGVEKEDDGTSGLNQSSSTGLTEQQMEVFSTVSITDKHVYALTQSIKLASPSPYALLTECLNRNCVPESDLRANMISLGRNRHYFEMGIGDNLVKVSCRNKREGRHLASQELLAILHPDVKTWSGILALYGPGSKPDKRCDSEAILDAQTQRISSSSSGSQQQQQASTTTVKTSLIRLLKTKMLELADQWESGENARRKGKFNVSPFNLPVVTFHPDAAKQIYSTSEDKPVEENQPINS